MGESNDGFGRTHLTDDFTLFFSLPLKVGIPPVSTLVGINGFVKVIERLGLKSLAVGSFEQSRIIDRS